MRDVGTAISRRRRGPAPVPTTTVASLATRIMDFDAIQHHRLVDGTGALRGPSMLVVKTSTVWPRAAKARHSAWTAKIGPPYRTAGR